MALGGGTFTVMNKELPGTYINFVSAASASAELSDRGIVTMPLVLDWGKEGEVFEVTNEDFQKNSLQIFGYNYNDEKMKGIRELFLNARTLYAYRLGSTGSKAANELCEAVCSGSRGNSLMISVSVNEENDGLFDVRTLLDGKVVDEQTAAEASMLADNGFVAWNGSAELAAAAGIPLTGGTDGTVDIDSHQDYLNKIESYGFNAMGAAVTDNEVKNLYVSFVKRMRDEEGVKFQLVLYRKAADYPGVVNVVNSTDDNALGETGLVYWVTGACGGCRVNRSNQNKVYDGELAVNADYTQAMLKKSVKAGEFVLHRVGTELRVLEDINSFVSVSEEMGECFKDNQTVRVIDQIANDIAVIFNTKYLGAVPNDPAGRVSLWSDIVKHHEQLQDIRAIEGFSDGDVTVEQGSSKKSVVISDAVTVVNAMSKLYMTVTVA